MSEVPHDAAARRALFDRIEAAWPEPPFTPEARGLYAQVLADLPDAALAGALAELLAEDRPTRPSPGVVRARAQAHAGAAPTQPLAAGAPTAPLPAGAPGAPPPAGAANPRPQPAGAARGPIPPPAPSGAPGGGRLARAWAAHRSDWRLWAALAGALAAIALAVALPLVVLSGDGSERVLSDGAPPYLAGALGSDGVPTVTGMEGDLVAGDPDIEAAVCLGLSGRGVFSCRIDFADGEFGRYTIYVDDGAWEGYPRP